MVSPTHLEHEELLNTEHEELIVIGRCPTVPTSLLVTFTQNGSCGFHLLASMAEFHQEKVSILLDIHDNLKFSSYTHMLPLQG